MVLCVDSQGEEIKYDIEWTGCHEGMAVGQCRIRDPVLWCAGTVDADFGFVGLCWIRLMEC